MFVHRVEADRRVAIVYKASGPPEGTHRPGIASADVIFRGIREYKPQPQRINYVSSVIRLVLVYTVSESRCLRSIFASLRNGDRFAI